MIYFIIYILIGFMFYFEHRSHFDYTIDEAMGSNPMIDSLMMNDNRDIIKFLLSLTWPFTLGVILIDSYREYKRKRKKVKDLYNKHSDHLKN